MGEGGEGADEDRKLLSHTSGIVSLESEDLGRYYRSLGDERGTLMQRYFFTDDPVVKAKALEEVRVVMGTLVRLFATHLSNISNRCK